MTADGRGRRRARSPTSMHFARMLRARRAAGRARPGASTRCDAVEAVGLARARRLLLDAARRLRQPARPARALRPGLPPVLAQPEAARAHDGAAAAADQRRAAEERATPSSAGALAEALQAGRRQPRAERRSDEPEDRDRRGDDLLRPRAPAAQGFRADVGRGARRAPRRAIARLRLPIARVPHPPLRAPITRGARIDLRATLRAQAARAAAT